MASYMQFTGGTRTARATDGTGLIRDWSNRDAEILPQSVIATALDWAADRIYKTLRIPPLEYTRTFTVEESDLNDTYSGVGHLFTMPAPSDMIELIYLRRTVRRNQGTDNTTFNYRLDNRTLLDSYAERQFNSFTRVGNDFILYGDIGAGDIIEIHYYRRLPGLDATYAGTSENAAANLVGEAPHWLRDENERILLYGALIEVFNYLNEPESMSRYVELFDQEIQRLNSEEMMRDARGGNIKVSYNGGGLL